MTRLRSIVGSLWILGMAFGALANPVDLVERQLSGVTPCGPTVCARGMECCNFSCGICTPPGGHCTQRYCGERCGPSFCSSSDEVCCNETCGICTKPGKPCPLVDCNATAPERRETETPCGPNTCAAGEVCCNESCGYCTKPGEPCTLEGCGYCTKPGEYCTMEACLEEPVPCGPNTCGAGEVCCNESCGYCTKPGEPCTEEACLPGGN
ncbi:hypothetical protein MMYC01_202496 [Madurella mycetomatis]|uniref:Uncharacterized protein n=1 Tax=Madurella mycetomatis TaxID=100816 RepID=A0A175WDF2_9PEZI|nr:hypothetical protein MMYC01_202496 [Madurella mycetomatis]